MPLCFPSHSDSMSTDPQIREMEKRIAQEARTDQKNLDHVIKDLKTTEKNHQKAIKVCILSAYATHVFLTRHAGRA